MTLYSPLMSSPWSAGDNDFPRLGCQQGRRPPQTPNRRQETGNRQQATGAGCSLSGGFGASSAGGAGRCAQDGGQFLGLPDGLDQIVCNPSGPLHQRKPELSLTDLLRRHADLVDEVIATLG